MSEDKLDLILTQVTETHRTLVAKSAAIEETVQEHSECLDGNGSFGLRQKVKVLWNLRLWELGLAGTILTGAIGTGIWFVMSRL